ncbi:D-glucuronyl C5-epimerase family protein [Bradyrhizobium brasilense]|uniref:D-glucuronyl C5-epimerase family protein n=1 Tax=Bradyrhizobium brasilense TaxID=1419277 RepID=UPI0024B182A9|nr:D-glucuronyl C5-epimerase family protein [Bradyrhizobium australafricanum]WFU35756.1 D-glucuronyl C5-epimerase family protein [Bradyrhizobium australafricanum]
MTRASAALFTAIFIIGGAAKAEPMQSTTTESSPYLGIPALVEHKNAQFLRPYFAMRAGLRVRYVKNIFSTYQPDMMWFPSIENGRQILAWQTFDGSAGLYGVFPGSELELVDDTLYDFGVGALFVKVKSKDKPECYLPLETLVGETEPANSALLAASDRSQFYRHASVEFDGIRLYEQTVSHDRKQFEKFVSLLARPEDYATQLSGGQPGGVHPLFAASSVRGMLFTALSDGIAPEQKADAIASAEIFAKHYISSAKREVAPGVFAWPYNFEWTMNWGIKLSPPWYSAFANGQILSVCALLYRLTGKDEYKTLAGEAFSFIKTPISSGGSEYDVSGFKLPAEYVYPTPPTPNVRVLDGELAASIAIYNASRLLGDSEMLRVSFRYLASLAMQLDLYTTANGDLRFSMYGGSMPDGYRWPMWAMLQEAAIITKDRRFTEAARKLTPFIGKAWCDQYGC